MRMFERVVASRGRRATPHRRRAAKVVRRQVMAPTMVLVMFVAGSPAVRAWPLTDAQCAGLMAEFVALKTSGIDVDMAPGPDNARERLGPERMLEVKRYLDVDGDILFRCPNHSMSGPGAPHNVPVRNPMSSGERLAAAAANYPPLPPRHPIPSRVAVTDAASPGLAGAARHDGLPMPQRKPARR